MTERQVILLEVLLVVIGLVAVLWIAARESGQARALRERAEQAEACVSQLETADPPPSYTRIPTAEIRCEEPADGYCGRYVLYRLTATD